MTILDQYIGNLNTIQKLVLEIGSKDEIRALSDENSKLYQQINAALKIQDQIDEYRACKQFWYEKYQELSTLVQSHGVKPCRVMV